MKIGILTYHFCCNFGANLQALSTVCFWRRQGHEAVVINWLPPNLLKRYQRETSPAQQEAHHRISRYYAATAPCADSAAVAEIIRSERIDAVCIGSDAVIQYSPLLTWVRPDRRRIFRGFYFQEDNLLSSPYLAGFGKYLDSPIPTAMFSVSAQNMPYQHLLAAERAVLRKRLTQNICSITVRDTWTQRFFQQVCGMPLPQISPDPVFGFEDNTGDEIEQPDVIKRFDLPEKYVLLTLPCLAAFGREWREKLAKLFRDEGIACFALPTPGWESPDPGEGIGTIHLPLSPLEWYALLKQSRGYIGINMHPVVTCIHNEVPFYALDQYAVNNHLFFGGSFDLQSSKTFDLLNRCGFLDN